MTAVREWFFRPAPASRLAAIRWLVLTFALVYLIGAASPLLRPMWLPQNTFRPVGIVSVLHQPLLPPLVVAVYATCLATGFAALLGLYYRWTAPSFAVLLLWATSYRSSWGMLFHTENLLVMHVAVLACCPQSADTWSWRTRTPPAAEAHFYGWPLRVLSLVTVSAYVVAGLAKFVHAGPAWLGGDEIRAHIAFDAIRKLELGSVHSALGVALVKVPWLFAPLAIVTLALELGAPLALLGGRCAVAWAVVCWGFHFSVLCLMMIVFPYPLSGVAFASLFPAERVIARAVDYLADHLFPQSPVAQRLRRHVHG